jgi:hypothetical protein
LRRGGEDRSGDQGKKPRQGQDSKTAHPGVVHGWQLRRDFPQRVAVEEAKGISNRERGIKIIRTEGARQSRAFLFPTP